LHEDTSLTYPLFFYNHLFQKEKLYVTNIGNKIDDMMSLSPKKGSMKVFYRVRMVEAPSGSHFDWTALPFARLSCHPDGVWRG
jgi:hypothetical protein